jgi:hypothetical protein
MQKSHIWIEEPQSDGVTTRLSAVVESPSRGRLKLWYQMPSEVAPQCQSADAFVIGNIFLLMSDGVDTSVHAPVSPSLLKNLHEFQAAWQSWRPGKYKQIGLSADSEVEAIQAQPSDMSVAAFTGGVDSCFTMFRHRRGDCERIARRNIVSGLFVHGFDISLEQSDAFNRAAERIRKTLDSVGVRLITMSTNLKALNIEWNDTHIAGIASCLHLLKERYGEGLIGSSHTYDQLTIPWGSNPVTDHLLSGSSFRIVHDGAAFKRWQKVEAIAGWAEGFDKLRVCYSAQSGDENCGRCLKCTFLIFLLRNMRIAVPPSFPHLTDDVIATLGEVLDANLEGYKKVVQSAKRHGIEDTWVDLLSEQVKIREAVLKQKLSGQRPIAEMLRRFLWRK